MAYWDGTAWVPDTPVTAPLHRGYGTRLLGAAAEGLLIVLLVSGLVAGNALAAKGGGGGSKGGGKAGSGTIAGPVVVQDANGNGLANAGDQVTFQVTTTASDRPFVGLRCWQGSTWVYDGYVGYFDDYLFDQRFVLGSGYWQSGTEAVCTARLFYYDKRGNQNVLATLDFAVQP